MTEEKKAETPKTEKYKVVQPNTGKHSVGDIINLTDAQAASLVNKVKLLSEVDAVKVDATAAKALAEKDKELEAVKAELAALKSSKNKQR